MEKPENKAGSGRDDASVPVTRSPFPPPPPEGGATVLVVDDEALVRKTLVDLVRMCGYTVRETDNGPEALRILDTEPIDLVLVDMVMPSMGGLEISHEIRRRSSETKILLISGYSEDDSAETAQRLGIQGILHKPLRLRELDAAMRGALLGGSSVSEGNDV